MFDRHFVESVVYLAEETKELMEKIDTKLDEIFEEMDKVAEIAEKYLYGDKEALEFSVLSTLLTMFISKMASKKGEEMTLKVIRDFIAMMESPEFYDMFEILLEEVYKVKKELGYDND